jgi:hypothetical protein
LILGNSFSLKFFKAFTPNLNRDFPNLFNQEKSFLLQTDLDLTGDLYPWRIQISEDQNFLYLAAGLNGAQIWDISDKNNIILVHRIPLDDQINDSTDGIWVDPGQKYMITGEWVRKVNIYDITDPRNPVKLSNLGGLDDADDFVVTQDLKILVIANGDDGVALADISDKSNPFILFKWAVPGSTSVENIDFYKNESFVIASIRYYGFAILEINSNRDALV